VYGMIERADVARQARQLPLGLAVGATVVRPVAMGAALTWDDVVIQETQTIVRLRREQDAL